LFFIQVNWIAIAVALPVAAIGLIALIAFLKANTGYKKTTVRGPNNQQLIEPTTPKRIIRRNQFEFVE